MFNLRKLEDRIVLDGAGGSDAIEELQDQDSHDIETSEQSADSTNNESQNQDDGFSDDQTLLRDGLTDGGADSGAEGVHILVVASNIADADDLAAAAKDGVVVVRYDFNNSNLDGLSQQISDALNGNEASSIAFASHSSGSGEFILVDGEGMNAGSLEGNEEHARFWGSIGTMVSESGRIDVLACNAASNDQGLDLISKIESLSLTNVAASTDLTGNQESGGDWDLETDGIDAKEIYFDDARLSEFDGVLAAPQFNNLDATPTYTENGPPIALDNNVTVSDADSDALNGGSGDYNGANTTLHRQGAANNDDVFVINNGANTTVTSSNISANGDVIATYTNTGGTLSISYTSADGTIPTTALVSEILQAVSYKNRHANPPAGVTIEYTIDDGSAGPGNTAVGTIAVTITPVNDPPMFNDLDANPTFTEDGAAIQLDANATVSDIELDYANDYHGAIITLARQGGADAEDVFDIPTSGNITVGGGNITAYTNVMATYTIVGGQLQVTFTRANGTTPTPSLVNEVLQAITYSNSSDNPPTSVVVGYTIDDGSGSGNATNVGSINVDITAANDAPAYANLDAAPTFTEDGAAVQLDADVAISDPELDALNGGNGDYDGSIATIARQGGANSDDVFAVTAGGNIAVAGNNISTGGDVIATWSSNSGTLTISYTNANGTTPTTALASEIMQRVTYSNSSDSPAATVTLVHTFNDGSGAGNAASTATQTVNITATNDSPSFTSLDNTPAYTEGGTAVVLDSDALLVDPEHSALNGGNGDYDGTVLTLSRNGGLDPDDTFAIPSGGNLTVSGNSIFASGNVIATFTNAGGQLQITFSNAGGTLPTSALASEVLRSITYENASNSPPAGVTIDYLVDDGSGTGNATGTGSIAVTITATNDQPTLAGLDNTPGFTEGGLAVQLDNNATIADLELDALNGGSGDYDGSVLTLARQGGASAEDVFAIPTGGNILIAGANISNAGTVFATFTMAGGQLQVSFTSANGRIPTTALVSEVMQAVTYENSSDAPPATADILYTFDDGSGAVNATDTGAISVTITGVNDAPVLAGLNNNPTFTEGGSAVVLDSDGTVTDPELDAQNSGNGNYHGAVLTLARQGGANGDDVLNIPSGGNIAVSGGNITSGSNVMATYTNVGGELQITFTSANGTIPTTALVSEVMQAVTYANSSDTPAANITIEYTINDASGAVNNTDTGLIVVNITPSNDPPSFSGLDNTPSFTEGGAAVALDANATIADPELDGVNGGNGNYHGATLTIARNGGANANDVMDVTQGGNLTIAGGNITAGGNIMGTYALVGGQLQVSFTSANGTIPTTALVNEVLQAITYENSSEAPAASVTLDYTINDGVDTGTGAITVSITSVNDQPALAGLDNAPAYTENGAVVALDNNATIADLELDALNSGNGDYNGSTLVLARNLGASTDDVFAIPTAGNLTVGSGNITAGAGVIATYTLSGGTFTVSFTSANGSTPTTNNVNEILQAVTYENSSDNPPATAAILYTFDDGSGAVNATDTGVITVTITSANDAPVFTGLDASPTFVENGAAVVVDNNVTASDPELATLNGGNGNYHGAVITIARQGGANADDVLSVPSAGNLTVGGGNISDGANVFATYTEVGGQLQITFTSANGIIPTTALVNEVVQGVTYENQHENPPATVTLSYLMDDGVGGGNNTGTSTIAVNITATNDQPAFVGLGGAVAYTEDGAAVQLDADAAIADPELDYLNSGNGDYHGAVLSAGRQGGAISDDVFTIISNGNLTVTGANISAGGSVIATFTSTGGQLQVSFTSVNGITPTTALASEVIHNIRYENSNNSPPASVNIEFVIDDGSGTANATANGNVTVNITAVNDQPAFTNLDATPTFTENGSAVIIDANATINDGDLEDLNSGNGNYSGAVVTVARNGGADADDTIAIQAGGSISVSGGNIYYGGNIVGTYTSAAGQLQITYTDAFGTIPTTTIANQVFQSITYENTSDNPPASVLLDYDLNDGSAAGNADAAGVSVTVNITAVNDQPTLAGVDANPTFIEDGLAIQLDGTTSVVDPELDALNGGSGDYHGATIVVERGTGANADDVFTVPTGGNLTVIGGNISGGGNVIATYTSTAGTLTITFTNANASFPTTAIANEVLQAIAYTNTNNNPPATVGLKYTFDDGSAAVNATDTGTMTVNITSTNDLPVLAGLNNTPNYTEAGPAVVLDADGTIADPDYDDLNLGNGDYSGGILTLQRQGGANADDVFDIPTAGNITASAGNITDGSGVIATYINAGGQLQITFTNASGRTPTTALANEVMNAITYACSDTTPPGNVTIEYTFDDTAATDTGTITVNLTAVNDAPSFSGLDATPTYVESGAVVQIDANATVVDPELDALNTGAGNYHGASISVARQGGTNADDVFDVPGGGNIAVVGNNIQNGGLTFATITNAGGTLTLNFTSGNGRIPTTALVSEVLQAITYANNSNNPPATANLLYTIDDGSATATDTGTGVITMSITSTNDAPTLAGLNATPTFTEDGAAVQLDNDGTIADPDLDDLNSGNGDYSGATLTLVRQAGIDATDVFDIPTSGNLTVAGNTISTGGDAIATFTTTGGQLQVTYTSGFGTTVTTALANEIMQAITYASTDNNPPVNVVIKYIFDDNSGSVTATDTGTITVSMTAANDPPAFVGLDNTPLYVEDGSVITLDSNALVSDPELDYLNGGNGDYDGAIITVARQGGANAEDIFDIPTGGNITVAGANITVGGDVIATFTNVGGQVQITFSNADGTLPTTALTSEVLNAITYENSNDNPPANVTIAYIIDDGSGAVNDTGTGTVAVTITASNDAPVLAALDNVAAYTEDGAAAVLDNNATVADPELDALNGGNGDYTGAVLTLARQGGANVEDVLSIPDGGNITVAGGNINVGGDVIATYTNVTGTLTISFVDNGTTPTTAYAMEVMRAVTYENSNNNPPASVVIQYTINDGSGAANNTDTGTITVNITAANDAPVINGLNATPNFIEDGSAVQVDADATITDAELDELNAGNGDYHNAILTVIRQGGANGDDVLDIPSGGNITAGGGNIIVGGNVMAAYTSVGGQLQVTFTSANGTTPTTALVNEVMQAITYENQHDNPPASVTLQYTIDDGSGTGTATSTDTVVVTITSVNDAPVLAGLDNAAAFTEDGAAVQLDANATVSDPELDYLNGGNGNYSGTVLTLERNGGADAQDVFDIPTGGNITVAGGNITAGNVIATYTLTGGQLRIVFTEANGTIPTTALANEVLNAITYENSSNNPPASVVVDYNFNDASGAGNANATGSITVTITAANDQPVLTNLDASTAFTEDGAAVQLDANITIADPELDDQNSGNGDYHGAVYTLLRQGGANADDVFDIPAGGNIAVAGGNISSGGNIIASYTNAAGQIQVTFTNINGTTPTTSLANEVLRAFTYSNANNNPPASVTLEYTVDDGSGTGNATVVDTIVVNITAVNDAPSFSGLDANPTFVENGAAIALDANAVITDNDLDDLNSGNGDYTDATIVIARNGGANADDTFDVPAGGNLTVAGGNITAGGNIIATYASVAGTMTITFVDNGVKATSAYADEVLQAVTYSNSSNNPPASVDLTYDFDDASGSGTSTATGGITVNITAVNDPPILTNIDANPTYIENGAAVALDNNATISDLDLDDANSGNGDYNGAILTLARNGGANAEDVFNVPTGGNIAVAGANISSGGNVIATFTSAAGQLQITFTNANTTTPTTALANEVMRSITYANSNDNPGANAVIKYTFDDGSGAVNATANDTMTVNLTATNDAPAFNNLNATPTFVENGPAIQIDADATVTDPELDYLNGTSGNYDGVTIVIARNGGADADDTFSVAQAGNLTVAGGNISTGGNIIATFTSIAGTMTVTFTDANVTIPTTALASEVLQGITYSNSNNNPPATADLKYTIDDGVGGGNNTATQILTVNITAVNDAPAFAGVDNAAAYTEDGAVVDLDDNATISDADLDSSNGGNGDYNGSTLTFARNGGADADDVFDIPTGGNLTVGGGNITAATKVIATYTNVGGELQISFTSANGVIPTTAYVNEVLQAVTYENSSDNPPATAVVKYTFDDGSGEANNTDTGTITVTITAANDAPVFSNLDANPTFIEDAGAILLDANANVADPELDYLNGTAGDYHGAVITVIRQGGTDADDVFDIAQAGNLTVAGGNVSTGGDVIATYASVGGTMTITFSSAAGTSPTTALANEILQAITYNNVSNNPPASVNLQYTINDDSGAANNTDQAVITVDITAANDLPVFTNLDNSPNYTEDGAVVLLDNNATISDADIDDLNGGSGDYTGTVLTVARNGGANALDVLDVAQAGNLTIAGGNITAGGNVIATYTDAAGTLAITFATNGTIPTTALANEVLRSITYETTDDNPPASVVLTYTFDDAYASGSATTNGNITVNITAANDQPVLSNIDANVAFVEDAGAVQIDADITIADPELDYLNSTNGDYDGGVITLVRQGGADGDDVFDVTAGGNLAVAGGNISTGGDIIATYASVGGTMTVTFTSANGTTATTALANEVLRAINYNNTNDNPPASATLLYTFNDTSGAGNATVNDTIVVNITAVNDPPVFVNLDATPTFVEDAGAIQIDANATVIDPELDVLNGGNGEYDGATIVVARNGGADAYDTFSVPAGGNLTVANGDITAGGNVIATFASAGGTLTITFANNGTPVTTALASEVLQAVTYENTSNNPPATAPLKYVINDGQGGGNNTGTAIVTINITEVNDAPAFAALDNAAAYTEDGAVVDLDDNATISDNDLDELNNGDGDYHGATLTFARQGGANVEDVLNIPTGGNLTVTGNNISAGGNVIATFTNSGGTLAISFTNANAVTPTTAFVNEVLQAVTYENSSDNPPANATILYTFDDASGAADKITTGTIVVTITAANDAPVLSNIDANPTFVEDGPAIQLDADSTVADPELDYLNGTAGEYHGAVITVARQGGTDGDDVFDVAPGGNLAVGGGNVTTGGDVIAAYASVGGTLTITFSNADGTTPTTALANEVLRAITYSNSNDNPPASVDLQYTFDDNSAAPNATHQATMTVNITAVNDAPSFTGVDANPTFTEDGAAVALDNNATVSDPELAVLNGGNGDYNGASITIARDGGTVADDVFDIPAGGNLAIVGSAIQNGGQTFATFSSVGGTLTVTFTSTNGTIPSQALVNEVLRAVTYSNSSDNPPANATLKYTIDDGVGGGNNTGTATMSVNITATNDQPVFTDLDATPTFVEGGAAVQLDSNATIADAELDALNTGAGDYTGATLVLARNGGANADDVMDIPTGGNLTVAGGNITAGGSVIATYTNGAGTLSITFADNGIKPTTLLANEVLQAINYQNTNLAAPNNVTIDYTFNDTSGAANDEATGSITVTNSGVNSAPSFAGIDATPTFIEDGAAILLDADGTVSDPELDADNGASGNYAGAKFILARQGGAVADDVFSVADGGNLTVAGGNISNGNNVIATFTSTGGTLTVTFANNGTIPTSALADEVLQAIEYENTSGAPPATATIVYTIDDGAGEVNSQATDTLVVSITANNDQPSFTNLDATPTFIEDAAAIPLDADATISDPELDALNSGNGDYDGAVLTLIRQGGANADDTFAVPAGGNITISGNEIRTGGVAIATFTSAGGQLQISFTSGNGTMPTTALTNEVMQAITYTNSNDNPPATAVVEYTVDDGSATGNATRTGTITVSITAANDSPAFAGLDNTPTHTENGGATPLDANATISDPELDVLNGNSGDYSGAVLTVVRSTGADGDDVFDVPPGGTLTVAGGNITSGGSVIATYTNGGGTLAITFADNGTIPTTALVNEVLQAITYETNDNTPPASIIARYKIDDGSAAGNATTTGTLTISITSDNDPPAFNSLDATPTYIENGSAVQLDADVTISDSENDALNSGDGDYHDAVLTIRRNGGANTDDAMDVAPGGNLAVAGGNISSGGNVIASYVSGAGQIQITFTNINGTFPTTALVSEVAQAVTYANSNDNPPATAVLDYIMDDGSGGPNQFATSTLTVNITAVNDAPSFSGLDATPTYVENGAAVQLDANATLVDPELDNLNGTNGEYAGAVLTLARQGGANVYDTFDVAQGGNLTVANGNVTSGNVIATFASVGGTMTITFANNGTAVTTALANEVLQAITYSNANNNPPATATIAYEIDDGSGGPNQTATGSIVVNLTSVNDPPVFTNLGPAPTYVEDGAAIQIDADAAVADPELAALNSANGNYDGAILTIERNGAASGDDIFDVAAGGSLTIAGGNIENGNNTFATFVYGAGTITVTFTSANGTVPTSALVNEVLQAVTYENSNNNPPANVTLKYMMDDGVGGGSNTGTGTMTVNITASNDQPAFADLDDTPAFTEDGATVQLDADATVSDAELDNINSPAGDYHGAILTLARQGGVNGDDVFSITTGGNIVDAGATITSGGDVIATYTNAGGQLQITFDNAAGTDPTTALVNEVLESIKYSNSNNNPPANVTIGYVLDDGSAAPNATRTGSITVSITAANDAPSFSGLDNAPAFTEDGAAVALDANAILVDPELDNANSGNGDYDGAVLTLVRQGGASTDDVFNIPTGGSIVVAGNSITSGGNEIATFTNAAGQLQITFTNANTTIPTTALANEILQAITYSNSNDNPPANAIIEYTINDGTDSGTGTITVGITAANDQPVFTGLDDTPTFAQTGAATPLDTDAFISDVELDYLNGAAGNYNNAVLTLQRQGGANGNDIFDIPTGGNITVGGGNITAGNVIATFTNVGGTLAISFTSGNGTIPTTALVNEVMQAITYANNLEATPSTVTLEYNINDASGAGNADRTGTVAVSVIPSNDPPIFANLDGTPTFVEDGSAVALDTNVTISDNDLDALNGAAGDYTGASLALVRNGGANAYDVFDVPTGGNLTVSGGNISTGGTVIATISSVGGTGTITFVNNGTIPTTALANEVIQAVTYANTSNNPAANITVDYTFDDSTGAPNGSVTGSVAVTITAANDAPVLSNIDATPTFVEDGATVILDNDAAVADPELDFLNSPNGDYNGAVITVARNGGENADDYFNFTTGGNLLVAGGNISTGGSVIATYTSSPAGTLTVIFTNANLVTPTTALANEVLQAVEYGNLNSNPPASVNLQYTFDDGVGGGNNTDTAGITVNITAVNDVPVLAGLNATPTFVENGSAVALDNNGTMADPDLDGSNSGNGDYNGVTLVLARNGGANSDDEMSIPTAGNLTVGGGNITTGGNTIATYTMNAGTFTVSFTSAGGTIPTTALANEVMQGIAYLNTNDNPPANVQIDYLFNDGSGAVNNTDTGSITVNITAANDPPAFAGLDNVPGFTEGGAAVQLDSNATVSDPELDYLNGASGNYTGASITILRQGGADTDDIVTLASGGNLTVANGNVTTGGVVIATYASAGGQLVVTFANNGTIPTTALASEVVQAATYENSSITPPVNVILDYIINDGSGAPNATGAGTITVAITPVNDQPVLAGLDNTPAFIEDGPAVLLDNNATVSDNELNALNGGNGDYSGSILTLNRMGGANTDDTYDIASGGNIAVAGGNITTGGNIIATYTGVGGQLQVTLTSAGGTTPTTALANEILQAVTYTNASDVPPATAIVQYTFDDGSASPNATDTGTVTVSITAVNDAPAFVALDNNPSYSPGGQPILLDDNAVVSDPEADNYNAGNGNYNGVTLTVARAGSPDPNDVIDVESGGNLTVTGGQISTNGNVIATYTNAGGALTIQFTGANGEIPTTALTNEVMQAITYSSIHPAPPPTQPIEYSMDDGTDISTAVITVNFIAPPSPPPPPDSDSDAGVATGRASDRDDEEQRPGTSGRLARLVIPFLEEDSPIKTIYGEFPIVGKYDDNGIPVFKLRDFEVDYRAENIFSQANRMLEGGNIYTDDNLFLQRMDELEKLFRDEDEFIRPDEPVVSEEFIEVEPL